MKSQLVRAGAAALAFVTLGACAEKSTTGAPPACTPNATQSCDCPGGDTGVQTCDETGSGYSDCSCPVVTSSSSGSASSSGSSSGSASSSGSSSGSASSSGSSSGGTSSSGGGACTPTSDACATDGECCDYLAGNGYCVDFGSGGACADTCTGNGDCTSGCCQPTTDGTRVCSPSSECSALVDGAPCTESSECSSGLCLNGGGSTQSWCSQSCSASSACPSSPVDMWCSPNSSEADFCWPVCSTDGDCAMYGPTITCKVATSVEGVSVHLCQG